MRRLLIAVLAFAPLTAHALSLAWPIDCKLGETCFIQNFVEHGSAQSPVDFACDGATFHGLTGTDIRIKSLAAMRAGVAVLAATDGVVLGTRDGVDDISIRDGGEASVKNRECGNGVNIQNADGYSTQYCHMRKGSVLVRTGQQVKTGDALGLVGMSGETEFPHLHINILKGGAHIDPFTSAPTSIACDAKLIGTAPQLWATPIAYQPTNLLNDGVVDSVPDRKAMLDTPVSQATLPTNAPAMLYWAELMNVRMGDVLTLSLTGPDGSSLAERSTTLPKNMAAYFHYIGKKNSSGNLAPGVYHARVALLRHGVAVIDHTRSVTVK